MKRKKLKQVDVVSKQCFANGVCYKGLRNRVACGYRFSLKINKVVNSVRKRGSIRYLYKTKSKKYSCE